MGTTRSTYGERRGVYRGFAGKPEGNNHLGDPGVDGRILRWSFRKWDVGGLDWIELAEDTNAVMNFRIP